LPAVVFDEPVSMVAAVELDDQSKVGVIEVSPRARLGDRSLNLRTWKTGLQQEPSQSRLHW